MFNWNALVDESALRSVLSDGYARFLQPVREGLVVFLEGLPAAQQREIVTRQAELSVTASISERLALLARTCPVLHKLGQILARDQRLAPELRMHLQELESIAPTVGEDTIRNTLARELGPLQQRGVLLMPPAIAEASVAVVVPFRQLNEPNSAGVFKLLKPGIEERLQFELELLTRVGSHLDQRCHELGIPHLDYEELFEQIREKLQSEIRLDEEQNHLAQAAKIYADDPRVHIPALMEHCTPRVTAMERIYGVKVTDHGLQCRFDRRRLSELVVATLIAHPFFSRAKQALFHCDPHAGNIFLTDENRLAILDWSLVGWLGEREQIALVRLLQAAIGFNAQQMAEVLEGLAERRTFDSTALAAIVQSQLRRLRYGEFPGLVWLTGLLDEAVQTAKLRFSTDLMLLRKSLHMLEGVLAEIGADEFQIDHVLFAEFLTRMLAEWPERWIAPPASRRFSTHLSNFDLAQMWLGYPATIARLWLDQACDLLDGQSATGKLQAATPLKNGH